MTTGSLLAHQVRGPREDPEKGTAEPLLILNGGLMTYAAWEPLSARLEKRHRLILCDLRGQLLSPGEVPAELEGNVADLTALLDHLGVDSTHVLGASYGGLVGVLMAALEPERVRSLIAVTVADHSDEAMRSENHLWRRLLTSATDEESRGRFHERLVEGVYSEGFKARVGKALAARRAEVAAMPESWWQGLRGVFDAVAPVDLRPHLAAVRAPTLVVVAADDRMIPVERSLALAAGIAGAETRIHDTSGHALVAEDPAWLAEVTLDFLARHAAAGRPAAAAGDPTPV